MTATDATKDLSAHIEAFTLAYHSRVIDSVTTVVSAAQQHMEDHVSALGRELMQALATQRETLQTLQHASTDQQAQIAALAARLAEFDARLRAVESRHARVFGGEG